MWGACGKGLVFELNVRVQKVTVVERAVSIRDQVSAAVKESRSIHAR